MNFYPTIHEKGYVKGLRDAEQKGIAAASDPQFTEKDNPYKRWEHRKSWIDGFRKARKTAP